MIITSMIDVIETSLRLLSPFAPFLTEELWQRIPACLLSCEKAESISQSTYPTIENVILSSVCSIDRMCFVWFTAKDQISTEQS